MNQSKDLSKNLHKLFSPESVAVVGTNNNKGTVPHDIFDNIVKSEFQGAVYPVSPGCRFIKCMKTVKYVVDIDDPIDMAVLVFPSHVCDLAMEQCGQKGIKSVVVISAGFKEIGPKGIERERKLQAIADRYGISFIGPNCLGVINTDPNVRLNASFARQMPAAGNIAFLSQSGALCTAVLDYAEAKHIGFSKFVSFGNKSDVSEIDLLYFLKDDPATSVILLYLEEITDGRALMDAASNIIAESGKPILILKSGRTAEGAAAAASHTGSLAGRDEICDAALKQSGIIRCATIEDMFNTGIALAYQPLPKSNRVAIVTNAGGPGVLATDASVANGLIMSRFDESTKEVLKKHLPKTANINNPVDVIGDARADRYSIALHSVMNDPSVDGVFVILTPQSMTDIESIAEEVCRIGETREKPMYTSFMGESEVANGISILQRHQIPHYQLPESMCKAFANAYSFKQTLQREPDDMVNLSDIDNNLVESILSKYHSNGSHVLSPIDAQAILSAYGIPVARSGLATTKKEAVEWANVIGFPVAMKVVSESLIHKMDIHGVRLHIRTPDEAAEAFEALAVSVRQYAPDTELEGILVQQMVSGGVEWIVGMKRDPSFGPVLLSGLGGMFVEILHDVNFRVAPIGKKRIHEMLGEIKSFSLLNGIRGTAPKDIHALEDCLARLSRLVTRFDRISEMDINPIMVLDEGKGCCSVDVKIML